MINVAEILEKSGYSTKSYSGGSLLLGFCPFHNNTNSPSFMILPHKHLCCCKNPSCEASSWRHLRYFFNKLGLKWVGDYRIKDRIDTEDWSSFKFKLKIEKEQPYDLPEETELLRHLFIAPKLMDYLQQRGFTRQFCRDNFVGWDQEKKTIMLPLFNGSVFYGFNKRVMFPADYRYIKPKGLPKTKVYHPKQTTEIEGQEVYVCEGYMDALKLVSLGLRAVCVLGSAITPALVRDTYRFGRPVLAFDNDEAGKKAVEKWLKLDSSLRLEILKYPTKDPGDLTVLDECVKINRVTYALNRKLVNK